LSSELREHQSDGITDVTASSLDTQDRFHHALQEACGRLSLEIPRQARECMFAHYTLMVQTNERVNLTRITDPAEAAVRHYADSLAVVAWIGASGIDAALATEPQPRTLLDLGTGAGFPAVPIAIARPDVHVSAIDGTGKKVRFVQAYVGAAGLKNLAAVHTRAEAWDTTKRFSLVVARALASGERCLKWAAPFLAAGGRIVLYKSEPMATAETSAMRRAAGRLGLVESHPYLYELPDRGQGLPRALRIFHRAGGD